MVPTENKCQRREWKRDGLKNIKLVTAANVYSLLPTILTMITEEVCTIFAALTFLAPISSLLLGAPEHLWKHIYHS